MPPRKHAKSKKVLQPQKYATFLTGNKRKSAGGFLITCSPNDLTKHPFYSDSCLICLEDISAETNTQLNCGHNMCISCISRMITETEDGKNKCPCCRAFIDDISFQNREYFKPIIKLCDDNWSELEHHEYLDHIYEKNYMDENQYDSFKENYKYTWAYKQYNNKKQRKDAFYRSAYHLAKLLYR